MRERDRYAEIQSRLTNRNGSWKREMEREWERHTEIQVFSLADRQTDRMSDTERVGERSGEGQTDIWKMIRYLSVSVKLMLIIMSTP